MILNKNNTLFIPDYSSSLCFALDLNVLESEDKMRELLAYRKEAYDYGLQLSTFAKKDGKWILGMNPDQENSLFNQKEIRILTSFTEGETGIPELNLLLELGQEVNLHCFIGYELEGRKELTSPLLLIVNSIKNPETMKNCFVIELKKNEAGNPDFSEFAKSIHEHEEKEPVIVLNHMVPAEDKENCLRSSIRLLSLLHLEELKLSKNN